jgi:hypothetical protein
LSRFVLQQDEVSGGVLMAVVVCFSKLGAHVLSPFLLPVFLMASLPVVEPSF